MHEKHNKATCTWKVCAMSICNELHDDAIVYEYTSYEYVKGIRMQMNRWPVLWCLCTKEMIM